MNIYVFDHCWEGADFFVGDTIQEALEYFRSIYLPEYQRRDAGHNYNIHAHNPWLKDIKRFSGDFSQDIEVYEIVKGLTFSTNS